jgi:serine/threonine protein kinase
MHTGVMDDLTQKDAALAYSDMETQRAGADTASRMPLVSCSDLNTVRSISSEKRYEARSLLGKGGMGEVQLCQDGILGREVARKRILRPDETDEPINCDTRLRFVREAQIQGQLDHPGIVPVYDLGVAADGGVYFTMKRLRGRGLDDILHGLRSGNAEDLAAYSRHRLLQAFLTVCCALDFAHSRGVLHRDLKPSKLAIVEK